MSKVSIVNKEVQPDWIHLIILQENAGKAGILNTRRYDVMMAASGFLQQVCQWGYYENTNNGNDLNF